MNGPQDVGGRHGFGRVIPEGGVPEHEAELFHAAWEARVLGLTLAAAALGHWTIDASRHARESLPPALYYGSGYYRIWFEALERMLVAAGEVAPGELQAGRARTPGLRPERRLPAAAVPKVLAAGGPTLRAGPDPVFAPGDRVRTRNHQPAGHTRLPAYARGQVGEVTAIHGCHVLPDRNAHAGGEAPCPLYTVVFAATELFGADADPGLTVSIDAWEPYLDRA